MESVGIGAAGWVDNAQAVVRFSPHLAWRAEPLKARLAERIDLPLIVDNDANAAAWAEYRFGAGRGSSVMVCITLGTGIGGGLVIDGQLFRGTYGMAGEWGHMISVPGRSLVRVRQPRLLGAVRVRQRAGPRGPGAGPDQLADRVPAAGDGRRRPGQDHRPGGDRGGDQRRARTRSSCWPTSAPGWAAASPTWPPRWIRRWW